MLRKPAFHFAENYAQNGASLIGSIRWMRSEKTISLSPKVDELIGESASCSPLQDLSVDHERIACLSGYFKALISQKDCFEAKMEMDSRSRLEELDRKMKWLKKDMSEPPRKSDNYLLPKVLPFPVEACNLDDLILVHALPIMHPVESYHSMGPNDNADLIWCIMKEFIFKLWGFHYRGVIHGNLKPQNVLICKGECNLTSTVNDDSNALEWKAPEQILLKTQTMASDMFTFGCILYFCITKGCHPFGDTPEQRIQNIKANNVNISRVKDYPDAYHLISLLLNPEPKLRPKANDAYNHLFFKNLKPKVELLEHIFFHFSVNKVLKYELGRKLPMLRSPNWRKKVLKYLSTYRYSNKQPFEDFKDIFGQRGSPRFFPSMLMIAHEVACKINFIEDDHWFATCPLEEDDFPLVERESFRRPFFFHL